MLWPRRRGAHPGRRRAVHILLPIDRSDTMTTIADMPLDPQAIAVLRQVTTATLTTLLLKKGLRTSLRAGRT